MFDTIVKFFVDPPPSKKEDENLKPLRSEGPVGRELADRFALLQAALEVEKTLHNLESTKEENGKDGSQRFTAYRKHLEDAELRRATLAVRYTATDVFVEKAIRHLTLRARFSLFVAVVFFIIGIAISLAFITLYPPVGAPNPLYWLFETKPVVSEFDRLMKLIFGDVDHPMTLRELNKMTTTAMIVVSLGKLAVTGMFLAGLYMCYSFSKSFIQEWSVLYSRRHNLRLGRLAIYLRDGEVTVDDIVKLFDIHSDNAESFKSIDAKHVTKGVIGQMAGVLSRDKSS